MFIGNLIAQWQESVFSKKQRDSVFFYSFFLGRITGVNYSSAFSRIVCRWRNILYLVIHMKMNCAIIKAERIARWYVLIKLIVVWKEGKRWIIVQYWQIFSSFLIFCCYFTRLKVREISCKIWETRKIFPILPSAPYDNNYKKHTYVRNCTTFIKKFTKKASFDIDWVHMER